MYSCRQGKGLRGLTASFKAMSSDNSKVLLTPRLARRLASIASAGSTSVDLRSPSSSPSREPLCGDGGQQLKKKQRDSEGLQMSSEQSQPPGTPPTRSPSMSASSSSSSSSSPAIEPTGELRREPMNIYNLNSIIRDQVLHGGNFLSSFLLTLLFKGHLNGLGSNPSFITKYYTVFRTELAISKKIEITRTLINAAVSP